MNTTGQGGFQKERSGNPGGRPRKIADVRELARQLTPQAIATLETIMNEQRAPASARVAAAEALLNRAWGRPAQTITGDNEDDQRPIVLSWMNSGAAR